jgi:flagellar assembly factor FliW
MIAAARFETAGTIEGEVLFADGLPGFESSHRFVLVASPTLEPFTMVKGLDDASPAFLAIDPRLVAPAYDSDLPSSDRARLGADPSQPLVWLAVVSPKADGSATVNLRAPIVISPSSMRGVQLVRDDTRYPLNHPFQPE